MTIGTVFTLFFVPAIYLLVSRDHQSAVLDSENPLAEPSSGPRPALG